MRPAVTHPSAFPAHRLRALTGETEFALARAAAGGRPRALRVTDVLAAGLEGLSRDQARALSAGSRAWLLQQLAGSLRGGGEDWFEGRCEHCGALFDLAFDLGALPAKPPEAGFPAVTVETSAGPRRFEIPNGFHEEALAVSPEAGEAAQRRFVALAGLDDDAQAFAAAATADDLACIDAALEAASPEAAEETRCQCPGCGEVTEARVDPLAFAFPREAELIGEIHQMAGAYHWSERDILALPTSRRRRYLELIGAERHTRVPGRAGGRLQ